MREKRAGVRVAVRILLHTIIATVLALAKKKKKNQDVQL